MRRGRVSVWLELHIDWMQCMVYLLILGYIVLEYRHKRVDINSYHSRYIV